MAALYSGIHLKLKNSKVPWEDKLKLAHFAWISQQYFIPNKEQVLLDWVCHTLIANCTKKLDLKDDTEQKLWSFLDNILHSKKLQNLLKKGKSLNLRFTIAQVINDFIESSCTPKEPQTGIVTVLSCCHAILSTPALAFVYTAKCELIVELLSKLSVLACRCLTLKDPITHQVLEVLLVSLNQYIMIQRQQNNPNRIFCQVVAQLFQPLLILRHTLSNHSWDRDKDSGLSILCSKEIRCKAEAVLQMGLFQAELISSYKEELLTEKDCLEKKKVPLKILLTPVCSLLSKLEDSHFCEQETYHSVVSSSIPLLYKLFLNSYCRDGNQLVCFNMLVRLYECLQTTVIQEQNDQHVPNLNIGLYALDQILSQVISNDIYNTAVDRIRHQEVQFNFYSKLAKKLIFSYRASVPAWFRCLKDLLLLNHLIVEPDMEELVSYAWVYADISDMRIRKAQEILIASLLETYAKLRQFPKLFKVVLLAICRPATGEQKHLVLSPALTQHFVASLIELPPNQILDIWTMILERCSSDVLPLIKNEPDTSLKLITLSAILHCLLFNMKSIDNNTPLPVIVRLQDLMRKMMDELIQPSLDLINDHVIETSPALWLLTLCDSTLLLIYTWLEVNTMIVLNCSKYTSQLLKGPVETQLILEQWDFSALLGNKSCWEKILTLTMASNAASKYYLGLLSVQKLKHILMQIRFPSETVISSLKTIASFVFNLRVDLVIPEKSECWGGSAITVNKDSFLVAYWHLIASNLLILHPYISAEETKTVADFLLETLLLAKSEEDPEELEQVITFKNISVSLLQSDVFAEMRALQCAFITSIIKKCAAIMQDENNNISEIFTLLSSDTLHWHEEVFSSNRKVSKESENTTPDNASLCCINMENAAKKILSMTSSKNGIGLSASHTTQLVDVISFLTEIKPDSLTPLDQSRCFLLLLSSARADSSPRTLHHLTLCYKILSCLLDGKHSTAVFKLLYASDILEIVFNSLLKANWNHYEEVGRNQGWLEFVEILHSFFESFLKLIVERKQSVLINLEKCTAFLLTSVPSSADICWTSTVRHLFLVAVNTLCKVITSLLLEQRANKQRAEVFASLLQHVVLKMGTAVNQSLKISVTTRLLPSFLVSCMTSLLEAELSCLSLMDTSNMKLENYKNKKELLNIELYKRFSSQIMKELCYADNQNVFLKSSLHYLAKCITAKEICISQESAVLTMFSSVKKLLTAPWINVQITESIHEEVSELFNQMEQNCSNEEFYTMLKLALQWLEVRNLWEKNDKDPFAGITVIKLLLACYLNEDNRKLFWFSAPQVITSLVTLSKEACRNRLMLHTIVVPALEVIALLLRQGEVFLTNPHHITLSFDILLAVPLDHLKAEDYYSIFLGVHEVLFSILQCHSKAMLKSVPSFLNSFHKLVASVMHEGRQKGDKVSQISSPEFEVVLKCARLVERMYTHIAAKTEEFTVFSAFIVSQYINELQKVTLNSVVKKHLTEGIFHILDLCIERDIKFLNASLPMGVKEVFKELYNEFTHYYKTKNQADEKYKA
ncbi:unhealthy ribosome biogenesis protein 2 homolog [Xenopus laevis]|uniref:Unhealthy ribosome biogenesis protein 2 homolog n=1 Tax=Xenopus laevis TaxID=8355 RepID=A0A8J1KR55_XENLA|nr:unhealthy ribosome biogenesis protein 2 homolog [Xenopus laevis]XP_041418709.1 unhealthy ribosome biogenesis protein 2 homolog [Xenopus laevis]